MTKTHKAQHSIPKCYLKKWCDPDSPAAYTPYIWIIDKSGQERKRKSPENSFVKTDLYTIKRADGGRDLVLENGLSALESKFSTIRRSVLSKGKRLSEDDRFLLCAFTAAMHARTEGMIDHQKEQWTKAKEMMDKIRKWAETATVDQKRRASAFPPTREDVTLSYSEVSDLSNNPVPHLLSSSVDVLTHELFRMGYYILETKDKVGFITSDSPCVWFDPEAYRRPPSQQAVGLMYPKIEITLPLSPSQMILFHHGKTSDYVPISPVILDEFNKRTRFYSHKHFIVNANYTKPIWFEIGEEPEDSWRKRR